ncbi:MAG: peptidoglycan-binding protein, partial [Propionibacteriaceae bacterium]|nr:peptidoglycan-binding protein [Propionibacteriaceae bacterium]
MPLTPLPRRAERRARPPIPAKATPEITPQPAADRVPRAAPPSTHEAVERGLGNRAMIALLDHATTPAAAPEPAPTRRMIRYGSQGTDVEYAQERLNAHGAAPPLAVDGIFGPLTRQATLDYQRGHGLDVDAIIGPRTWASLEGPTSIGGASGSGHGGAGGPGSSVMMYDTGGQTFNPPAQGTTMATIRTEIKAKQDAKDAAGKPKPELGPTVDVKGVTVGTPEELYVWNVLLQRAERDNWGGEVDVVTEIGPKAGGPAPVGQISIKIDGSGNATAILLNRGPVAVPAGFADEAAAIAALKALGFSTVENGTGTWTLPDL